MYLSSVNKNKSYNYQPVTNPVQNNVVPPINSPAVQSPQTTTNSSLNGAVAFGAAQSPAIVNIRTQLTTNEEKTKYSQLSSILGQTERKNLELLLKSGILLNTDSNDKTSTLDSLYKIASTPRATGLNPKGVLTETINTIVNPFTITQNFGDIPKQYRNQILQQAKPNSNSKDDVINDKTIDVNNSSACVSASIEFNLAKQMPAEFARFAQELSSPKLAVNKTIQLKNLSEKTLDAVWLLDAFKVPYQMNDFKEAKLVLAPDKNAIVRAQIQNSNRDYMERSVIDTLMQSTFMNVGSQQTYDTLTDIRGGTFNWDNKGLIEFEKTFTESVVEDKNKTSITYQVLDDNGKVVGSAADAATIKKHILDSLKMGENVIIGYTYSIKKSDLPGGNKNSNEEILTGHEITIIGVAKDKNGKLIFICNDTDDDNPNPIGYSEDYLIPKIHHAGLPQAVVENDVKFVDSWVDGVNAYKNVKAQSQPNVQNTAKVA